MCFCRHTAHYKCIVQAIFYFLLDLLFYLLGTSLFSESMVCAYLDDCIRFDIRGNDDAAGVGPIWLCLHWLSLSCILLESPFFRLPSCHLSSL